MPKLAHLGNRFKDEGRCMGGCSERKLGREDRLSCKLQQRPHIDLPRVMNQSGHVELSWIKEGVGGGGVAYLQ